MDPFNSRRSSVRRSLRLSSSSARDEEEEYDLAVAAVADGFRPTPPAPTISSLQSNSTPPSQHQSISPSPSQSSMSPWTSDDAEKLASSAPERPSSTSKPLRPHDSLTIRNDGSTSLSTLPLIQQSQALSLDAPQIRPQSPYRGPTGPSHPYQMYPQRTLSNATSSTTTPTTRNSYDGPRRPTHPYGLYTQNIVPNGDQTTTQNIPVGFTGAGDNYRRQLGPDGEEAGDLIGPLGHTEELPPYTRYPDESPIAKTPTNATPDISEGNNPVDVAGQPITGAGGIGVATRNPEFSSTEEDLQHSRSRLSTASQHDINTAAQEAAEKPQMNKWQRRAKKKLWGIVPYWAICLLIIGVIIMGIIMGAVIGTVLSRHKPHESNDNDDQPAYAPTPTPTADIVPLSVVPAGLPPLATGPFSLPPLVASQAPKSCFNDTNQNTAWSCDVPFRYYDVSINFVPKEDETGCYFVNLTTMSNSPYKYIWGTQIPNIPHAPLKLVNDTFEPRRGPAWWLKLSYDKTVIVPEESLSVHAKRWDFPEPQVVDFELIHSSKKNIGAEEGDKPWVCVWPDTTLEVFIYPSQNISAASRSASTTSSPAPTASPGIPGSSRYLPDPAPLYPKAVKFLERRTAQDNPKAYCRQVRIINGGYGMANLTDSGNNPVEIEVIENLENYKEELAHRQHGYSSNSPSWYNPIVPRGKFELTPCGCLWWSM